MGLRSKWGQLQLEQYLGGTRRVEKLARERLGMRPPVQGQVMLVEPQS